MKIRYTDFKMTGPLQTKSFVSFRGHYLKVISVRQHVNSENFRIVASCQPHCCKTPDGVRITMDRNEFLELLRSQAQFID